MTLITSADYPQVRAVISLTLNATNLPDAIIGMSVYQGAAEATVLARFPDAASEDLTDEQALRVKNATIYLTAALIAPAVPQLLRGVVEDLNFQMAEQDMAERAAQLRLLAEAELAELVEEETGTVQTPFFFGLACGRRGKL